MKTTFQYDHYYTCLLYTSRYIDQIIQAGVQLGKEI